MSKQIINPGGAHGYTSFDATLPSTQQSFKTSAAVTAKRIVSIGTTGLVAISATDGTPSLCVGQAVSAIASGEIGLVAIQGIAEDCIAEGTIAAGAIVKRSATTAGAVAATATPAAGEAIGVAINASAGGTVDVWLKGVALS